MYCSDKQFVDIAVETGVSIDELHSMLKVVLACLKRWGSLVKLQQFHDALAQPLPAVASMIHILYKLHKLDVDSLQSLLRYVGVGEKDMFVIEASHGLRLVEEKLQNMFDNPEIEIRDGKNTSLQVAGNGRWYKRSLDKDLDILLA